MMKIIPAIDLINGQCVRLVKGDFERKTVYANSPVEVAVDYQEQGAKNLHIIDLDGAKAGKIQQEELIAGIARETNLSIQVGGGVRSADDVKRLRQAGVNKVILGSVAIKDPKLTKALLSEFGSEHIVLAIDVTMSPNKVPCVAIQGWQEDSKLNAYDVIKQYMNVGLTEIVCTDISRDGMETGPNFELYEKLQEKFPNLKVQASGGVSSCADLEKLAGSQVFGVIIGKALYEKRFTLKEALAYGE